MLTGTLYILMIGCSGLLSKITKRFIFRLPSSKGMPNTLILHRKISRDICKPNTKNRYVIGFVIAMLPLTLLFTLRYGIGKDYFAYEEMYHILHDASFKTYYNYHSQSFGDYYVEPLYYILNRISPSYTFLQFLIFSLLSINLALTENEFPKHNGFIIYIFFSCNFIYALNATRYVLGLSYMMLGIAYLLKNKNSKFFICIAISALLHKTFLVCFAFYLLKGRADVKFNWIINKAIVGMSLGSAIIIPLLMRIASKISIFSRYFTIYTSTNSIEISSLWIMHILPIAITLLFIPKERFVGDSLFSTLFRIYVLEIPFRFMAFYNVWYGRLARIPQVAEAFMIPYIISIQKKKSIKIALVVYYTIWYLFYFIYYYITDGATAYQWILGR